ncbi:MAG: hypothetical protein Q8Q85_08800 [Gemmatimonadales bacterium]|nr:hypothetical protein [Gemmatimonadales bacterium]
MSIAALLLALQALARADSVHPVLAFPEPGLDDPAAYHGYQTRLYRDAKGNALQVYLNRRSGRVVQLWADAANQSAGFTARDSGGRPAALVWGASGAVVAAAGGTRSLAYTLSAPSPIAIGLFLLGSMRVERDFQYAGRDSLPLDAPPFPQPELLDLIANLERLDPRERARHLTLLGARTVAELRARLEPRIALRAGPAWAVRVAQRSFDGKTHLSLVLEGDGRETVPARAGGVVTIRSRTGGPVRFTVRVTTDAPALTALARDEIFTDDFWRFYDAVRADTSRPERFRRLEREVRGVELLCYREKVMAGLPNFATYFGRDGMMTALLMEPVWRPAMREHVIASVLRKLAPDGDVSHEEALGGQAIRENAAAYNRVLDEYRRRRAAGDGALADSALVRARATLGDLQAVRENYGMVDDDLQLPVLAARYLADSTMPPAAKRRFLLAPSGGPGSPPRLVALLRNLAFVTRQVAPYAQAPVAANLVGFPPEEAGGWRSASWRDSRVGYAGGRFAMDVNVVWAPLALRSVARILDALAQLGLPTDSLEAPAPEIRGSPLASYAGDRQALERAIATWRGAARHFEVAVAPESARRRIEARLSSLPAPERRHWQGVLERTPLTDTLRFLALSLDEGGRPIPVMNTDPGMLLLLGVPHTVTEMLRPLLLPYPLGVFVATLGPLAANDAYAPPEVWEMFRNDLYHSPRVVWGREVNVLLAALAQRLLASDAASPDAPVLRSALRQLLDAVERSGLKDQELWSYEIAGDTLRPARYGSSSDVQLWNLTDLAVQYLLARLPNPDPSRQ